jgi:outer membrane protein assembly factor BamB
LRCGRAGLGGYLYLGCNVRGFLGLNVTTGPYPDQVRERFMNHPFCRSTARFGGILATALVALMSITGPARAAEAAEELWAAARNGDVRWVEAILAKGVNVDAKTHYGASALWFAAYKGQAPVVALLLKRGADPNIRDNVWDEFPLLLAAGAESVETVNALLEAGARGAETCLVNAAADGKIPLLRAILEKGKLSPEAKAAALAAAPSDPPTVAEALRKAGCKPLSNLPQILRAGDLTALKDPYESKDGVSFKVRAADGLVVTNSRFGVIVFKPISADSLTALAGAEATMKIRRDANKIIGFALRHGRDETMFERSEAVAVPALARTAEVRIPVAAPRDWPSFRGIGASGVADGQHPPTTWDAEKGLNLRWKMAIPGVAHASPIVCGDRVFVTTAVSSDPKAVFKTGQFGAGTTAKDFSTHSWRIYCLDKGTGKIVWEREVHKGIPRVDRHEKSTQDSATPATDGEHLVAIFGSEGLYCYDLAGKFLWRQDLGVLDLGAFNDPDLKWGAGSSPIIYQNLVIVQCDRPKDGFLAAFDVKTGKPVWRAPRDEPPSWCTPTVIESAGRPELVANGTHFIRGYDARTGKELWRLGPNSEITVPTPFAALGMIFVTNGYRPIQPIYAVLPGATGDISPAGGKGPGAYLAWETTKGGPYLPTPIVYGPNLYVCTNQGILAAYDARTGRQIYKRRLGGGGGYTASPVAADGRLYFTSEDGEVRVVKVGSEFELLAMNPIGEACLASPAISDGMIFYRSRGNLFAFGGRESPPSAKVR